LAFVAVTQVAQGLFVVLFVVFVAEVLRGDAAENGLLRGVQAIGAICGGLLLGFFATGGRRAVRRPGRLAGWAALVFGALVLAVWNLPRLTTAEPLYVALFIAVGIPGIALVTGLVSALQESTVDGERGRVFAALGVASGAGQAVGMVTAGVLGDRFGVVPLLNVQGTLYLLAGLVALVWLTTQPAVPVAQGEPNYVVESGNSAR
jgi:MFS family permease